MANPFNYFMDNTGHTIPQLNSLCHLIDCIDPNNEREVNLREHSRYYNDTEFVNTLNRSHHTLSILKLNFQSINAKFD